MIKKKNFVLIITCILVFVLLFFPTFVSAKDLVYEADVFPVGTSGATSMTFRKYVKKFGGEKWTNWSYSGTLLKNQNTSVDGSYVTVAMTFHNGYGTDYLGGEREKKIIEVAHDTNPTTSPISTAATHDVAEDFFNDYSISGANTTKIHLFQPSNRWDPGWFIYQSGDIEVWRSKYLGHIAVTDFRLNETQCNELNEALKNNLTKGADGNYKVNVSGKLKVRGSTADATKGKTFIIETAQELYDIMIPSGSNAYLNNNNTKLNTVWDPRNFGYTQLDNWNTSSMYAMGHSALNNFDNVLYVPGDNTAKKVYVNHFDNNWNQLWWIENSTQKRIDKNGNTVDIAHNTSKSTIGGTWQEAYEIADTDKLNVRYSDKVKNGEKIGGKNYTYSGFTKNSYDLNWNIDSSKSVSGGNTEESTNVDGSSASDITTVDFLYTLGTSKNREIFVNHLVAGTNQRLDELANTSQIILPDYMNTPNLVGNSKYNNRGYMEYYSIPSYWNMQLKNSSKLNSSNKVQVNGIWYEYAYFNTCSGSTYDQAINNTNGKRITNQIAKQYEITHKEDVTIISFYYKPVGGGGGGSTPGSYTTNILGRLAFDTDYNLNSISTNSEFVPANKYLYPYIEGAQKYILPNVYEDSTATDNQIEEDVVKKSDANYWDNYEEYRSVIVSGTSKGGDYDSTHTKVYEYNENYTAGSTTVTSPKQPLKVYNGSSKNALSIAGKSITLENYAKTEGSDETITVTGEEDGYVKYTTSYTQTGSTTTTSTNPDGSTSTSTTYTYSYQTTYTNPFSGVTVITTPKGTGSGDDVPDDYDTYKSQSVPVTYSVTLRKKWKLSHLYLYIIENNAPTVNVRNGSSVSSDARGGVYGSGDSGIHLQVTDSYYTSLKNRLKTYYEDYNDIRRKIPSAIQNTKLLTTETDFKQDDSSHLSRYLVGSNKYNGLRKATATIRYKYYDLALDTGSGTAKLDHSYDDVDKNERINIYTPLNVIPAEIKSDVSIVNQTGNSSYNSSIQRNVPFTFKPQVNNSFSYGIGTIDTNEYLSEYYVKFDFNIYDIQKQTSGNYYYINASGNRVTLNNNGGPTFTNSYTGTNVTGIPAGTYIIIPKGGSIKATAKDPDVGQFNNDIRIFASTTTKISQSFADDVVFDTGGNIFTGINTDLYFVDRTKITQRGTSSTVRETVTYNGSSSTMKLDARYVTFIDDATRNLGRIYEFRITDCSDLGYKNVFRKNTSVNQTNDLNYFYTGKYYWYSDINTLAERVDQFMLPLGPYSNGEDKTYIYAPKLGYRISFDVKTTGYMNNDTKHIRIYPTYYYISKDGGTYYDESQMTLYYKNSLGKYVTFRNSNYTIQFKPNDGYRALEYPTNVDDLSTKYQNLKVSANYFTLTNSSMMTKDDTGYYQCWYGEFKLPNSTIAVKTGDSINKPLTNGYIGVKFKIDAVEEDATGAERTISYNNKDMGVGGGANNSTQWDYEGYLGYDFNSKRGADISSSSDVKSPQLQLGNWHIHDQATYEKIKSTVILYDIDERAANDFN